MASLIQPATESDRSNPPAEDTTNNTYVDQNTSELRQGDIESLPDDYVYVHTDQIPDRESEDIRALRSEPSDNLSYLDYVSQPIYNYLASWINPETANETTTNVQPDEGQESSESWVREKFEELNTGSLEEESRFRDCVLKAIYDHFDGLKVIDKDYLEQKCCLTKEELSYASESDPQFTRRILLMLLRRDTRTILSFLFGLSAHAQDIVKKIKASLRRYFQEGFKQQTQCPCCILRERVCMCLLVDHLPQCGTELLSFVNFVSEENQPAKPSVSNKLWDELFKAVNNRNLYSKVIQILVSVLEACGYHTDIVRMLNEDRHLERNSFVCRCQEVNTCLTESVQHQDQQQVLIQPGTNNVPNEQRVAEVQSVETVGAERSYPYSEEHLVSNERSVVGEQTDENAVGAEESHPNSYASSIHKDKTTRGENENRDGSKGSNLQSRTKHARSPNRRKGKTITQTNPPKRKQPDSDSEEELSKKKPPDTSMLFERKETNEKRSKQLKRKENLDEQDFNGKRSRNDNENEKRSSCLENCDLQIELLKIGIGGYDNEPDSLFSPPPSTSSHTDSGVYDLTTLFSNNVDHEETVPKVIANSNDLKPSHSDSRGDQGRSCDNIENDTLEETTHEITGSQYDISESSQMQLNLRLNQNDAEGFFSENNHSSVEQNSVDGGDTDTFS